MYSTDKKRYFWVGLTALLQGLLLWVHFGRPVGFPWGGTGLYSSVLLSIAVIVPVALWLSQDHWGRRLMRMMCGLFAALAVFTYTSASSMSNTNFVAVCIAVFFLLPYLQCRMASWSWHIPYSEMFFQFCRNLFLLFQAAVATGLFWLLLRLSAGLFEITGLKLLARYIFEPLVFYVLTSFVVAVAITLGLKRPGIDSVGRWILSILAWLLPPFAIVSIAFIAYLPFSGLKPLLDTGQASTLMLFLQLSLICLANSAWLDGSRIPFAIPINVAAKIGLLTLPLYSSLCIYSLGLRISQYGWSVERVEAAAMLAVVGVWGLGYALMVLLGKWPKAIGRVNLSVILLFCVVVTLLNTPLMDPRRLTAANQVARLENGSIKAADFDFRYMRFNLGRYGYEALQRLLNLGGSSEAIKIRIKAREALQMTHEDRIPPSQRIPTEEERYMLLAEADVLPGKEIVPERLRDEIVYKWGGAELSFLRGGRGSQMSFIRRDFGWIFATPWGIACYEVSGDEVVPLGAAILNQ